jgi:hypothetical protein
MLRKTTAVLAIAAGHFALCRMVVAATEKLGMFAVEPDTTAAFFGKSMVLLTRVLYFPVISLSLYSREWFPGNWIVVPMIVNSLLWAVVISGAALWCRRYSGR